MDRIQQYVPLWGAWHVESLIGEGSFGKVYKVRKEEFGQAQESAVKLISIPQNPDDLRQMRSEGMNEASARSYFLAFVSDIVQEIRLLSEFRGNSHIVSLEDYKVIEKTDELGWDILIRMELLQSLTDAMLETSLSADEVAKLGIHICKALELCATNNIIHRDIKPDNIFISKYGDYKLGDFGIARQIERTMSGLSKKGTYTYMAPEVFKGEEYGATVDTYSLGIVMYRLLNKNRTPFLPGYPAVIAPSDRDVALQKRMKGQALPPPVEGSEALKAVVLKACAFDRRQRYASATEMRQALEAVAGGAAAFAAAPKTQDVKDDRTSATECVLGNTSFEPQKTDGAWGSGKFSEDAPTETAFTDRTDATEGVFTNTAFEAHEGTEKASQARQADAARKKTSYWGAALCVIVVAVIGLLLGSNMHNKNPQPIVTLLPTVAVMSAIPMPSSTVTPSSTRTPTPKTTATPVAFITIQGKQYSTSLTELNLSTMALSNEDIEPLKHMTKLTKLILSHNKISDINALTGLTKLRWLSLDDNSLSDLSGLRGLYLCDLLLRGNQISDINPLSEMTSLQSLYLSNNQISDINALDDLTNLEVLDLDMNQISDIRVLSNLNKLKILFLQNNQISNIDALGELTGFQQLKLGNNQINDISALNGVDMHINLYLQDNPITDWSPIRHVLNIDGGPWP